MALPTYQGQALLAGQIPASMANQKIGPVTPAFKAQADTRVTRARQADLTAVNTANKNASWWNPWGYITGAWKAKKATQQLSAPITDIERQTVLGKAIKPLIENEISVKYASAIDAQQKLRTAIEASIPPSKIVANVSGPTGPGSTVTQKSLTPQKSATDQIDTMVAKMQKRKQEEAKQMADEIVIRNLQQVVQKPYQVAGLQPGKIGKAALAGVTLGVLGRDKRDPLVIEAERRQFSTGRERNQGFTGDPTDVIAGGAQLATMLIPYVGLEAGAVRIGTALRSVEGIDAAYKAYPYLTRAVVTNLGVNTGDALIRKASGQDYTATDFLLNLGLQGAFEGGLATQKRRILTHVDNEVRHLSKQLGRTPWAGETLERLSPQTVPGHNFTYGHLFAEQRYAYKNGFDHFASLPNPEAEQRLLSFSKDQSPLPPSGGDMPPPSPSDGQMNAFGVDKPSLFEGGQVPYTQEGAAARPTTGGGANMIDVTKVQTDPARFQFRDDVHPQLGYQESNVAEIQKSGFDPNQVRPLEIGRFPDAKTGETQQFLLNGHNTLELLKRNGVREAEHRVINLSSEQAAIEYARKANMISKAPEVLQKSRIATQMMNEGKAVEQIAAEMGRIKPQDARRYINIGYLAPGVQRQVAQGLVDEQLAGVLGDATQRLKLSPGVQEQMVQMVAQDKFTPNGLKTWLDIMGKHAAETTQIQGLFGTEEFQIGVQDAIGKVMQTKSEVDTIIRRINAAKGLEDIPAATLKKLERTRADLLKKRAVLEFLVLKKSGVKAPTLPKGVNQSYIDKIQAELFAPAPSSTVSVSTSAAPGIDASLNTADAISGVRGDQLEPLRTNAESILGTPSASRSNLYVSPSIMRMRAGAITDDAYVTSVLDASQKNLPHFRADLEELLSAPVQAEVKSSASLRGKIVRYKAQKRDIRKISDVLRAQSIIPEDSLYKDLEQFKNNAAAKGIKIVTIHDYFEKPDSGYRGVNIKIQLPSGQLAEVQLHTPDSYLIRETLHPRYEKFRNMPPEMLATDQVQAIEAFNKETGAIGDRMWAQRKGAQSLANSASTAHAFPKDTKPVDIAGIRTDKMSTEGAKATLSAVMKANPDLLISRTRGVVSDAAAVEVAETSSITKELLLNTPEGTILTKEQLTAARMLVAAHGEDTAKLAKTAAMEAIAGESTGVQKEYMRAMLEHARLQAALKGFSAEAGRGLQAFKMEISPLERLQGKFFDLVNTADKAATEALTKQAAKIDINDPQQVLDFIRKNTRRGWLDAVSEFLTAIKLTGPTTHVVNFTSNTVYNIAVPLFRVPVAAVDAARAVVTRTPRERFFREALADFQGMTTRGAKEAFNVPVTKILSYLKGKYTPFGSLNTAEAESQLASIRGSLGETWKALGNEMYIIGGQVEDVITRVPAIKGNTGNKYIDTAIDATGKVVRLPFRLLNAADVAMRTMAKSGEMYALATREAFREGLTGKAALKRMYELLENPTGDMLEQAVKAAEYRVFQEPMGYLAQQVNKLRGIPVAGPLIRAFILPFVKTPGNLIKRGYRPWNPREIVQGMKAGGGQSSEVMARFSLGSLTVLGLVMYALDGSITGSDPQDTKLRDELYAKGWQKYSIRIGDRYYAYDRIEPMQQAIKIAAAIADAYKATGEIDTDMLNAAVMDVVKGTLDRSYIRSMNDLLQTAFNPQRYGENWLKYYVVSQPIPALSRSLVNLTDTDSEGRPIVRDRQTMTEYLKSQIPGLAPGLKPKLDSFGRPVVRKTGALEYTFSPVRSTLSEISMQEVEKMRKDFSDMKELSAADREANAQQKNAALLYIANLKELPLEARIVNLESLKKTNPDLAQEVTDMIKRRSRGFTFRDETLSSLTVNARAGFMLKALKEMPVDQRAAQYNDWKQKKIMTPAVEKILKSLLNPKS